MNFKEYLTSLNKLTGNEIEYALDSFYQEEIKKGEYYLKEGQIPDKVSFVEKGLFRLFYRLNGEEKIMLFFSDHQFMTDYFGYLTNSPSIRPIQALEHSVIYTIERNKLDKLFDHSKNWERVGRLLAESAYITSVLRANRIIHDDYDTRVKTFIAEKPSLMQRIPQYMIASYLNMTPETLSRVKSRIKNNKQDTSSVHGTNESHFLI